KAPGRPVARADALERHVFVSAAVEREGFTATVLWQIDNTVPQRVLRTAQALRLPVKLDTAGFQCIQAEDDGTDFTLAAPHQATNANDLAVANVECHIRNTAILVARTDQGESNITGVRLNGWIKRFERAADHVADQPVIAHLPCLVL